MVDGETRASSSGARISYSTVCNLVITAVMLGMTSCRENDQNIRRPAQVIVLRGQKAIDASRGYATGATENQWLAELPEYGHEAVMVRIRYSSRNEVCLYGRAGSSKLPRSGFKVYAPILYRNGRRIDSGGRRTPQFQGFDSFEHGILVPEAFVVAGNGDPFVLWARPVYSNDTTRAFLTRYDETAQNVLWAGPQLYELAIRHGCIVGLIPVKWHRTDNETMLIRVKMLDSGGNTIREYEDVRYGMESGLEAADMVRDYCP